MFLLHCALRALGRIISLCLPLVSPALGALGRMILPMFTVCVRVNSPHFVGWTAIFDGKLLLKSAKENH